MTPIYSFESMQFTAGLHKPPILLMCLNPVIAANRGEIRPSHVHSVEMYKIESGICTALEI